MTGLRQITDVLSRWMTSVALALVGLRFSAPNVVALAEQEDGSFVIQPAGRNAPSERVRIDNGAIVATHAGAPEKMLRGSRAEIVLRPARFLFRPLELPQRAGEFLDGVVRAQIDRLTPWSAADAAFGCSAPAAAGGERITVTVAATARALVQPYVQAVTALGAHSASVAAATAEGTAPITVFEQNPQRALGLDRLRFAVVALLVVAALAAAASLITSAVIGSNLAARQDELARRIAERRAAIRLGREQASQVSTPQRALERRKYENPASVIVLDAVSQLLPDHTYVTEMRIEGDKLRLIGLTRDAPGLIRLMEQNPLFSRATFFAPTTRSQSDPGERFHIEARIEPMLVPRS